MCCHVDWLGVYVDMGDVVMTDEERQDLLAEAERLREEALNLELEGDSCHVDAKMRYAEAKAIEQRAQQ